MIYEGVVKYTPERAKSFVEQTRLRDHLMVGIEGDVLGVAFNHGRNRGVLALKSGTAASLFLDADLERPKPGTLINTVYGDRLGEVVGLF
jgi:hypothetical protein